MYNEIPPAVELKSIQQRLDILSVHCSLPVRGSVVCVRRRVGALSSGRTEDLTCRICQVCPDTVQWGICATAAASEGECFGQERARVGALYAAFPRQAFVPGRTRKRRRGQPDVSVQQDPEASVVDVWVTLRADEGSEFKVKWPRKFRVPNSSGASEQPCTGSESGEGGDQGHVQSLPWLLTEASSVPSRHSPVSSAAQVLRSIEDVERVLQSYRVASSSSSLSLYSSSMIAGSADKLPPWSLLPGTAGSESPLPAGGACLSLGDGDDDFDFQLDMDVAALDHMLLGLGDDVAGQGDDLQDTVRGLALRSLRSLE
jgi:hypothetical protein